MVAATQNPVTHKPLISDGDLERLGKHFPEQLAAGKFPSVEDYISNYIEKAQGMLDFMPDRVFNPENARARILKGYVSTLRRGRGTVTPAWETALTDKLIAFLNTFLAENPELLHHRGRFAVTENGIDINFSKISEAKPRSASQATGSSHIYGSYVKGKTGLFRGVVVEDNGKAFASCVFDGSWTTLAEFVKLNAGKTYEIQYGASEVIKRRNEKATDTGVRMDCYYDRDSFIQYTGIGEEEVDTFIHMEAPAEVVDEALEASEGLNDEDGEDIDVDFGVDSLMEDPAITDVFGERVLQGA